MLLLAMAGAPARAVDLESLYQSQAIVTGQGEANRQLGFEICFRQVLVRVSGDQRVPDEPAIATLVPSAGDYVVSFRYRDRLEGVPIHDEQGTYDRPHDLYCQFDPAQIDPLLASVGRRPWLEQRPPVLVLLAVRRGEKAFALASDGEDGPFMAESLAAAAEPLAIEAMLPDTGMLEAAGIDATTIPDAALSATASVAATVPGAVPLVGTLEWSDGELGWISTWRMAHDGTEHRWEVRGVSFDDAFRAAMRGAAQILSGNAAR
ncbi:MAG: DUF2066 domain-containing protein [Rhizobiaceae bacterium]|nr:DUF2066 domain-containing protein [Rhizobiaceae bacterium]